MLSSAFYWLLLLPKSSLEFHPLPSSSYSPNTMVKKAHPHPCYAQLTITSLATVLVLLLSSIPTFSPPALNLYEFYFLNLSLLPLLLTAHCLCLILDFTGFFAGLWQYPWNDLSVSGLATLLLLSSFSIFFIVVFLKCNLTHTTFLL